VSFVSQRHLCITSCFPELMPGPLVNPVQRSLFHLGKPLVPIVFASLRQKICLPSSSSFALVFPSRFLLNFRWFNFLSWLIHFFLVGCFTPFLLVVSRLPSWLFHYLLLVLVWSFKCVARTCIFYFSNKRSSLLASAVSTNL
jgi:hypothetical protein